MLYLPRRGRYMNNQYNQSRVRKLIQFNLVLVLILMTSLINGCLGSSHHFRKGKTLPSGEYEYNYGISTIEQIVCTRRDSDNSCQRYSRQDIPNLSRSFRLGVRDEWGIFPGVDAGYQMETNLVLEFDIRLAMPHILIHGEEINHAVGFGWGVGFWPDNTYFVDYVLSKQWTNKTLYLSTRQNWLATQLSDFGVDNGEDNEDLYKHNRRWLQQYGVGFEFTIGEIWLVPDQFHIQVLTTGPYVAYIGSETPNENPFNFNTQFNFGLGWHFK